MTSPDIIPAVSSDAVSEAPYFVGINQQVYSELLSQRGMPDSQIQTLNLEFRRKPTPTLLGGAEASYSPSQRKILLSVESAYSNYQKYMDIAKEIANRKYKHSRVQVGTRILYERNPFKEVLYTKKLVNYLQAAPAKRGMAFANKMLLNGVRRELNSNLLHESQHAIDNPKGGNRLMQGGLLLGLAAGAWFPSYITGDHEYPFLLQAGLTVFYAGTWGIGLAAFCYLISPLEVRARKFESEMKNHPQWRQIIEFHPK